MLDSLLRRYYLFCFLKAAWFWLPILYLFVVSKGVSYGDLMWCISATSLAQIVFELPSGVSSDLLGRKGTLIIGSICRVVMGCVLYYGESFQAMVLAFAIIGISYAFDSGTDSAFLYDTLKEAGREEEYKRCEGIATSCSSIGMGVSSFIGAMLATISFYVPIVITIATFVICLMVCCSLREPVMTRQLPERHYVRHLWEAGRLVWFEPRLRWLTVYAALMGGIAMIWFRFTQPYLREAAVPIFHFGWIYLVMLLLTTISSQRAYAIEARIGERTSLLIVPLILGGSLVAIGGAPFVIGLLLMAGPQFTWGFVPPVVGDYLNKHVDSHQRATVLSFKGFVQGLFLMTAAPLIGIISNRTDMFFALAVLGAATLGFGVILVKLISKSSLRV